MDAPPGSGARIHGPGGGNSRTRSRLRGAVASRARTLALLAGGLSNAQIAERLGISEKTVRNRLSQLFDKLGVWSRAQAIVFARERGFVA